LGDDYESLLKLCYVLQLPLQLPG